MKPTKNLTLNSSGSIQRSQPTGQPDQPAASGKANGKERPTLSSHSETSRTGFIVIAGGGVGALSDNKAAEIAASLPGDAPIVRIHIDTDQREPSSADKRVFIGLNSEEMNELCANASRFGPEIVAAVKCLGESASSDLQNGSKTTPVFTQLAIAYHLKELLSAFRWGIDSLSEQGATSFQVIVIGSNGGGVGSAVTRLIPVLLSNTVFRHRLMIGGVESRLLPPIVMTAYPIAYARNASIERQEIKILANMYAWLREIDCLLGKGLLSRVYAIGYSDSSGQADDVAAEIASVLGRSLFHLIRNYDYLMSRGADTDPSLSESYLGTDLPERVFPTVQKLIDQFYGKEMI